MGVDAVSGVEFPGTRGEHVNGRRNRSDVAGGDVVEAHVVLAVRIDVELEELLELPQFREASGYPPDSVRCGRRG